MNKADKDKRAISILNAAKEHEIIDDVLPEKVETRIKLAEHIVEQAREAQKLGEKGAHITEILFTADVDWSTQTEDSTDEVPSDDEELYKSLISEKIEDGLPIPKHVDDDVPELPLDLTILGDKEVQKLHSAYNACSARIGWLQGLEEAGESAAKFIADNLFNDYIATVDRKDIGGKAKTNALLKAEAESSLPELMKWRKREHSHSVAANKYKRLHETYLHNCEILSRHWTMRFTNKEG